KGHDFETTLRKIFNDAGFIVQKIQVTEGDGGLDMIVSYQTNQICVQSKDTENPLILKYVKDLESTMMHHKHSLGMLIYNSSTMKKEKYLTKQASIWLNNSPQDIIVCNEKQVIEEIKNFFKIKNEEEPEELSIMDFKADSFALMGIV
ncbi:11264_t:CDS:1, partial [Racocetra fulgida]